MQWVQGDSASKHTPECPESGTRAQMNPPKLRGQFADSAKSSKSSVSIKYYIIVQRPIRHLTKQSSATPLELQARKQEERDFWFRSESRWTGKASNGNLLKWHCAAKLQAQLH